ALVGFGIIEKLGNQFKVIDYGVIETFKGEKMCDRLEKVYNGVKALIEKYKPEEMALEELFFQNNQKTAINVAMARGVTLLAGVEKLGSDKLYEYTPMQIKQALTGVGRAEKKQVQYMTKCILNLKEIPKPDDAADALAVALTHAQTNQMIGNFKIQ
ncbi:MAG: crossover junction endodeoxyribonuclease RuvC, partial [Clostridiales bacterium]|nr:crossover junction endodeoxyribonuclease RuvC [Candidatus Apopatousia equi]